MAELKLTGPQWDSFQRENLIHAFRQAENEGRLIGPRPMAEELARLTNAEMLDLLRQVVR
jgi:hypothetical protein